MRILFLTSVHNSLSQRLLTELTDHGHEIRVRVVAKPEEMTEAATQEAPDLIIAPMLKIAIPKEVYSRNRCLIVHPGIKGDRGSSSLDWAIINNEPAWGVTILEAAEDFDAGPIWASHEFAFDQDLPTKSGLYRGPVTEAALRGVLEAIGRIETGELQSGSWGPEPLAEAMSYARGRLRPPMKQSDRAIDWTRETTASIVRKVRAADSAPGVLSTLLGVDCFLYGVHEEDRLRGSPGEIIAWRDGAICIGAVDGSVWISHLKAKSGPNGNREICSIAETGARCGLCAEDLCAVAGVKLPATHVLGSLLCGVPEKPLPVDAPVDHRTFREIVYREEDEVGYLSFDFYNGAMSTTQCQRLRDAFLYARSRPTKVIVLLGGRDFWSNGIHLNVIEASADPAEESWQNIYAMDDLVHEVINTMSHVVIAGIRGNAGAGGAILALAADRVFARPSVVLNPHYRGMGELYGSEYWTYLLPKRVGQAKALELTQTCQPLGARMALEIGFLDDVFGEDLDAFEEDLRLRALELAREPKHRSSLQQKFARRSEDESAKPLSNYRAEELERMRVNFFGLDPAYHEARRRFVFKGKRPERLISNATSFVQTSHVGDRSKSDFDNYTPSEPAPSS
ncbi:hydrogenase maturation protein [Methylocystis sp. H62]|uniref:enoyl-CoA hydratase-related protein n=1 Tax=Methylocystis sp. H62 TaxID=2785789 RepID=UPI0018C2A69F|nr:enoyl-CoA hydratase-related protein [Methylocystis sp. H62]MBG0793174.1 hydrogenase maturation protein [Methylocystis sp. H62]